jgi:hypothetical protein
MMTLMQREAKVGGGYSQKRNPAAKGGGVSRQDCGSVLHGPPANRPSLLQPQGTRPDQRVIIQFGQLLLCRGRSYALSA